MQPHGQTRITLDEVRAHARRFADHFDFVEAFHDLFPDHAQLHLREAVAHAAVNAEAERQVMARLRPIDDERVGVVDRRPRRDCPRRTTSPPCRPS